MYIQVDRKTKRINGIINFSINKPTDNDMNIVYEVESIPQDWKYCIFENGQFNLNEDLKNQEMIEEIKNNIRKDRKEECFPIINRGQLWYDSLTETQLIELKKWYQDWLDAPATLVEPQLPNWIE